MPARHERGVVLVDEADLADLTVGRYAPIATRIVLALVTAGRVVAAAQGALLVRHRRRRAESARGGGRGAHDRRRRRTDAGRGRLGRGGRHRGRRAGSGGGGSRLLQLIALLNELAALHQLQVVTVAVPDRVLLPRVVLLLPVLQPTATAEALDAVAHARVEEASVAQLLRFLLQRRRPVLVRLQPVRLDRVVRVLGAAHETVLAHQHLIVPVGGRHRGLILLQCTGTNRGGGRDRVQLRCVLMLQFNDNRKCLIVYIKAVVRNQMFHTNDTPNCSKSDKIGAVYNDSTFPLTAHFRSVTQSLNVCTLYFYNAFRCHTTQRLHRAVVLLKNSRNTKIVSPQLFQTQSAAEVL